MATLVPILEEGPDGRRSAAAEDMALAAHTTGPFRVLPPDSASHLGTGVRRLDSLLGGGWPAKSATLLYGPPFLGKEVLLMQSFIAAVRQGVPSTFILHTRSGAAMSERLRAMDPAVAEAEAAGLVTYIDLYSHLLGEAEPHPNVVHLPDAMDLVRGPQRLDPRASRCAGVPVPSFVAVESASTLMVDAGGQATFLVLRSILGRTVNRGGVAVLALDAGMHKEAEVQMVKHLCTGMVEFRRKGESLLLHVDGLETAYTRPGWVEYEFSRREFRLTGSFACRTIH